MKRKFLLLLAAALVLAFSGLLPVGVGEVADLEPTRILLVRREKGLVQATSDTGAQGLGATLEGALRDMQTTGQGKVFLDTAEAVLFHATARDVVQEAAQSALLRPAARAYYVEGDLPEAEDALEFLQTHSGSATLSQVRAALLGAGGGRIASLQNKEGRLRLIEP